VGVSLLCADRHQAGASARRTISLNLLAMDRVIFCEFAKFFSYLAHSGGKIALIVAGKVLRPV
jgi:hypothetical protein